MKKIQSKTLLKVRTIANQEIYYTYKEWETKEIDGVVFIEVLKEDPKKTNKLQSIRLLRKDAVEFIK
jgi:hypothetical protein